MDIILRDEKKREMEMKKYFDEQENKKKKIGLIITVSILVSAIVGVLIWLIIKNKKKIEEKISIPSNEFFAPDEIYIPPNDIIRNNIGSFILEVREEDKNKYDSKDLEIIEKYNNYVINK